MNEEWTEADEIIEEIWAIRRQLWQRFDNDPKRLMEHFRELEKHYTGPKIEPPPHDAGKSAA